MSDESQAERPAKMVTMSMRDLLGVLVLGGITGLFIWGVGLLLNRYVFDVLFCQNGTGGQCAYAPDYSAVAAVILGGILSLVGLIRLHVYRPLLIVLATALSLWGIVQLTWGMEWYWGVLVAAILYLLAFGLFTWIARIRSFWIALSATIVLVIAVRLALMR